MRKKKKKKKKLFGDCFHSIYLVEQAQESAEAPGRLGSAKTLKLDLAQVQLVQL